MCRLLSLILICCLLAGCVSAVPRVSATNFLRDSRTCERQTHQIAGEPEYQACMGRLGWPDPQTQSARIQSDLSNANRDQDLLNEAVNGLQFGLQWDLDPD
ncbi:hypothetical protein EVC62_15940 [Salinicola endophyticus]|uniref:DUF2799 domain-containing protein n=1 Tax=Salinicola endophyticus TaxID=1949083 RepID=A0ABY8FQ12_9GAMM|nr:MULTISPECIES: hypothetical protein [Salinicola]WFF42866.1 hypothetical protein EVC62_15940 [Salinicola endophyticus]